MAKIAILGATGFVGTALTLKLLDLGHSVVAISRRPGEWPIQHQHLCVAPGDVTQADQLHELLSGVDCVYYLVHGLSEDEKDFEHLEARGATNFAQAAIKAKLRKVIFLGGLGPEGELSPHLRSRHLVGDILALIPGSTLEFRTSIVLGANSTSFEMLKALAQRLPFRPYGPWLETLCQPIALEDLLTYLVAGLELQIKGHTLIELGGGQVVSYGELLDLAIKAEDVQRPKLLLPALEQRLLLPALDLVFPEFSEVAKKLFMSLQYPTVVTDNKAQELFPEVKPMDLESAMAEAAKHSETSYPAVWEGDFWKELGEQTVIQGRQGQQLVVEKIKQLAAGYPEKILKRLPLRKRK